MNLNEFNLSIEDVTDVVVIANECIELFITKLDPRRYENRHKEFQRLVVSALAMITATMIDKASGVSQIDRKFVIKDFEKKLKLSFKWEDYINKE
jgi:hypothetical protein